MNKHNLFDIYLCIYKQAEHNIKKKHNIEEKQILIYSIIIYLKFFKASDFLFFLPPLKFFLPALPLLPFL
jgi:hypothetical protein